MYARLTLSAAANPLQCIRDIGRLITSANPSISDLSGQGYSTSLSLIVDATPAGWTYVGSNKTSDQPTIGDGSADATWTAGQTTFYNWAFSAPCADSTKPLKYALFTHNMTTSTASTMNYFSLSGAQSVTSLGVTTNEGYRSYTSTATTANFQNPNISSAAATTIHVLATPRYITIIQEARGMVGIWETTSTPIHDRLNIAPFVQYQNMQASNKTTAAPSTVILSVAIPSTTSTVANVTGTVFNITDVNTSTYYGTADVSGGGTLNWMNLFQYKTNARANTIDSAGNPRYQVSPVFFQMSKLGYPVQFVTGIVPIYWCKAGLGNTGDTVNIGGETYYYFHTGAYGTATYGVLMKIS